MSFNTHHNEGIDSLTIHAQIIPNGRLTTPMKIPNATEIYYKFNTSEEESNNFFPIFRIRRYKRNGIIIFGKYLP